MAQNILTFLLINSILYLDPTPDAFGFNDFQSFLFLNANFVILIVFFENTLFRNITILLMFFLSSTVITFNLLSGKVAEDDKRLIAVIGIYKAHFGFFILLILLFTFVAIAFVRMNRELMEAIEFNMAHKVHFE